MSIKMTKTDVSEIPPEILQVEANISQNLCLNPIFTLRNKKPKNEIVKKHFWHDGHIEYCVHNKKICVYNAVLTQSHLDVLSAILLKAQYNVDNNIYLVRTSLNSLAKELEIDAKVIKTYLRDLEDVKLKIKHESKFFYTEVIRHVVYTQKGVVIMIDSLFVLYFMFYKNYSFRLPAEIQKTIFKMKTGIAKGIARYCLVQKQVKESLWSVLDKISDGDTVLRKMQKRNIRQKIKKDLKLLQNLGIFIKNDVVDFNSTSVAEVKL